ASAPVRSVTPSKVSRSRPLCTRPAVIVRGPRAAGSGRTAPPGPARRSGSSVRTSTESPPLMPCGRPMRATTTSIRRLPCLGGSALVDVEEVHAHAALRPERADDGAQGLRSAAVAADHLAEVVGVHAHLEAAAAPVVAVAHGHVAGMLGDA